MLIAVNNFHPSFLIPSPPNLEVVVIKLSFAGNHNISICTVYIPPNPIVALFNLLVDILNSFSQSEELYITVGDFNLPDICWSTLSTNLISDFMLESNLSQLITCVKGNILDLLLTNNEHLISHLSVSESTSFLTYDHFLVSIYVEHTPPQLNHKLCLITLMLTTKVHVIFNLNLNSATTFYLIL